LQLIGHSQNSFEVLARARIPAELFGLAECIAHQIFNYDGFVTVRLVEWSCGLVEERDGAALGRIDFRYLANFVPRDHS